MKTFKITLQVSVLDSTDMTHLSTIKDMENEIKSGKFQREILKDGYKEGIRKVKATFEEICK